MQSFSCTSHSECAPSDYPLTSTCVRSVTDTHPFHRLELCSLNGTCGRAAVTPRLSTILLGAACSLPLDQSNRTVCKMCLQCCSCRRRHRHQIGTRFPSKEMAARRAAQVLSSENPSQYACNKDLMHPSHNKTYLQEGYFNINMPYLDTLSRAQSQIYYGKQRDHQL